MNEHQILGLSLDGLFSATPLIFLFLLMVWNISKSRPISYPPVEKYADDAGVDIEIVKEAARTALSSEGKIAAILAINELLGDGKPLPLPSTNDFVNRLKSR